MSTSIEIHQQTPSSDDHTNTIKTTYEEAETDGRIEIAALCNKWDDVCGLFRERPELKTKPVNDHLETPLMIAVRMNRSHEFVKQLLNNVETHDRDKWCGVSIIGNNALHYAAKVGNIIDAKLMLQCLPETMATTKNIHGDTPATLAAKLGRKDMIDEVFNQYPDTIKMTYEYAETDLQIYKAALRNKWDDVCELFQERPELKIKPVNVRLETPLMIAVGTNSSHEFVKQLLNNVQHQHLDHDDEWCGLNIHGNNALHYAAKVGNMIDAKLMVECLPVTMQSIKNIHGDTPFLLPSKLGRKDMIGIFKFFRAEGNLIVSAIQSGEIGFASRFINFYTPDETTPNALEALATKPESFRSGNRLGFWCGLICPWMPIVGSKILIGLKQQISQLTPRICRQGMPIVGSKILIGLKRQISQLTPRICRQGMPIVGSKILIGLRQRISQLTHIIRSFNSVLLQPFTYVKRWLQQIQEIERKNLPSQMIVLEICKKIEKNPKNAKKYFELAIATAVKYGNVELIEECILAYPGLIWYEFDGYNLFHLAIKERQVQVYNLVYQMSGHKAFAASELHGEEKENALHIAAKLAPSHRLSTITGAALQLQSELRWYKEVETNFVEPEHVKAKNKYGKTPWMVFTDEHKDLLKEGQQWMKDTATSCTVVGLSKRTGWTGPDRTGPTTFGPVLGLSFLANSVLGPVGPVRSGPDRTDQKPEKTCQILPNWTGPTEDRLDRTGPRPDRPHSVRSWSMVFPVLGLRSGPVLVGPVRFLDRDHPYTVVAALIVTITFAAAITIPGDYEDDGKPVFLNERVFMLFMISDAIALFSSSTSLLMFLGILTSRYAEMDFLHALPKRLTIGLVSLFLSIAATMIAFGATLVLLLRDKVTWIAAPVVMITSIPVGLFGFLQFRLLVEIVWSTYGPSIFRKWSSRIIY